MSDSIIKAKDRMRQNCYKIRNELGVELRAHASELICDSLDNWRIFRKSLCILTYMPIKSEVDLTSLVERHPDKGWILPRIIPEENHRMVFHLYDADHLVTHPFGMAEPAMGQPIVQAKEINLALVPGLAFDYYGWRLGYGGGYFDRFLKDFSGVSVGITYNALYLESLPNDSFDIPVQWVVTELGIHKTSRSMN